jgi:cbb3-type cytochrome oxidase subunit 1
MEWFVRAFLKAALVWLTLGVTLGVAMALEPGWIVYRPAHVHMNLAGFVTMMIFGVAYHVIPRFTGRPLHDRALAARQWWASNAGLAAMVMGFVVRVHDASAGRALLGVGALLAAGGAYAFAYNLWRTIGPAVEMVPVAGRALGR